MRKLVFLTGAAKTNVTLYNKQQELKDQEEKVRRIQKVFDMIETV